MTRQIKGLQEDFLKFRDEPSGEARTKVSARICEQFRDGVFSEQESDIVKEILDFLSRDVEMSIRMSIAETLKSHDDLPHSVALRLANDAAEVSSPILEFSNVLKDEDLIEIIQSTRAIGKLSAIARRETVSENVANELVNTEIETVVDTLVNNEGAEISDMAAEKIAKDFNSSENIIGSLINRGGLSTPLAEKIVSMVSGKLQNQLIAKYGLDPLIAKSTINDSREKVTIGLISANADMVNVVELVNHLYKSRKLNHSIVLRALCKGDIEFFEAGMAKLAGIPLANARKLIHHGNSQGFAALFRAASMPNTMLDATELLLGLTMKVTEDNDSASDISAKVIELIIENDYEKEVPNMKYLLTLIGSQSFNRSISVS